LFGQAGVVATTSLGELIDAAALLACQPLPAGDRIGIVSNAGGAGVLAADACGDNGLKVAVLSGATQQRLREILPGGAAVAGPVDATAAVSQAAFGSCIEAVADDDGVDAVMAITVPTALGTLESGILGASTGKPLVAVMLDQHESVTLRHRPGERAAAAARQAIPSYLYPEGAARALGHAVRYSAWRSGDAGHVPELTGIRLDDARRVVAGFMATSRLGGWLPPAQTTELLSCYGITMVPTRLVTSAASAAEAAAELAPSGHGAGVVLKADVPGLVHKTEAGAVRLGLHTEEEVRLGYAELSIRFGADLRQVLVQPMITDGVEVLVGVVHEPVFGPLVVFGLGGIATEVLGDHVARLSPLTDVDADAMIRGIRAGRLLRGYRAAPPADLAALAGLLLRVSRLADEIPEVAELDLNPVIARHDGAYPVDARIRLVPAEPRDPFLRRLR
jgi:acyl-CoA synthetase (NDP forming)